MTSYRKFFLHSIVLLGTVLPLSAHAVGVQWVSMIPQTLYSQHRDTGNLVGSYFSMTGTTVTVNYAAEAIIEATGVPACHSSVPVGTRVTFRYTPHRSEDIYWFGAGGANDSPYGDWIQGAVEPARENMCVAKNLIYVQPDWRGWGTRNHYVSLSVSPPPRNPVQTPPQFACDTPAADGSVSCVASTPGSGSAVFAVAATQGHFYKTLDDARTYCSFDMPLYTDTGNTQSKYTLNVPEQQMTCPISVASEEGVPPAAPVVSRPTVGGSCFVGRALVLSMQATDPDGDRIRYLVDWDANGVVDQVMPMTTPAGDHYVPSGTTLTVARTYATVGTKTVWVRTQDEGGLVSAATAITFACEEPVTPDPVSDDTDSPGDPESAPPDLYIRVVPSLVRKGNTVRVNWLAQNVQSCTVTGNEDSWGTLVSEVGGNLSRPIEGKVTYTLSCLTDSGETLTKNATVNLVPSWRER